MSNKDLKVKVCAYVRVSTGSKDQKNSFENQKSYFERELNNDKYEFIGMYSDEGITGTSLKKRDGFNRMINDAGIDVDIYRKEYVYIVTDREPKFDMIFVKNTSRLARNILVWDVVQKLKQKGVYIYFLDMGKSTKEMEDEVILKIISVLDENESRDKSVKVRFGMEESARKGKLFTNGKLFGYNYIKDENKLEINEDEAKIIRLIFKMYSEGDGIRVIENYLRDNKITHKRTGKEFNKATILNILKNVKYTGTNASMIWDSGSVFNEKYATLKPTDKWVTNKNYEKIPPIISEEMFRKCEEIRNGKINTTLKKGVHRGTNEYVGILKCAKCGANYTFNALRGVQFYNCGTKKVKGVKYCDNINVPLAYVESEILKLCNGGYKQQHKLISDFTAFILTNFKGEIEKRIDLDTKSEVEGLILEYEKTNKGLERLLDLYTNLEIDKDIYLKRSEELQLKATKLKIEIRKKNKSNEEIIQDIKQLEEAISSIKNIEIKDKYTKEELMQEISYINVGRKRDENDNEINEYSLFFVYKWLEVQTKMIKKYELEI